VELENMISVLARSAATAKPFRTVIKIDIGRDGVICTDGKGESMVVNNDDIDAQPTIQQSMANLEKLLKSELNPAMAVMTGKLKITGEMAQTLNR
jgi:putative sterol carrier protein